MSGCRSCTGSCDEQKFQPLQKAEKLQKIESSGNPRYPHVFVGKQAIYSDEHVQLIVSVVLDGCNDECDCFTLEPLTIVKDPGEKHAPGKSFDVSQPVGESCWKLHALI